MLCLFSVGIFALLSLCTCDVLFQCILPSYRWVQRHYDLGLSVYLCVCMPGRRHSPTGLLSTLAYCFYLLLYLKLCIYLFAIE